MRSMFIWIALILAGTGFAQVKDPVLFTVAGTPVHVSEFEYIYNKNNGKDADYSRKSLTDYLNLYTKFKLKVQAARDARVDTIPSLIKELEGYRQQLTTNYLNDKEVTDRLAREVYDRQKKDLLIDHILFSMSPNATGEDTVKPYNQAINAIRIIKTGMKWDDAAKLSNDLNSAQKGGRLGWFTAMFPDGFYALENAAYSLKPGEVYPEPIRTRLGYHVLRLEAERPAYRRMEAAHILIKKSSRGNNDLGAQAKADSLYKKIMAGQSFEEMARTVSEDKTTAPQGGNIGYFGIGQFESAFEDAAFALAKDGDVSKPVESTVGWHLIKRLRKDEEIPYERAKRKIQVDIQREERFSVAQSTLIEKIKRDAGYQENAENMNRFASKMDSNFYTYKWKVPEDLKDESLFRLGGKDFGTLEFAEYVKVNTRQRLQGGDSKEVKTTLRNMLNEFASQKCLQFEEGKLEDKYPDFKALMREYREGILLFEVTKNMVWDRASEDTTGLKMYYEKNKGKYRWDERAMILSINLDTTDKKLVDEIYKFAKKNTIDQVLAKFDPKKNFISYQRSMAEKKSPETYKGIGFAKGSMTPVTLDAGLTSYTFRKVENNLPAANKTLDEARGYIIADYQDHLEMLWVEELKNKYSVKVNEDVFSGLVRN
ncbi:MAG TPA: peptidylprolyl isomerase [Saprospiraceae bacterium]|nr:peptidylprolyl isomerase [Saprospiraceae bacterium]